MHALIERVNAVFETFPLLFLEIWGRLAYVLGLVLVVCAFGGITFRTGGHWKLGRERVFWDSKALISVVLTIVLVMGSGYLGSTIVLVPGAQTLESLKDAMVFACVVLFGYPALIGVPIAYLLSDVIEGVSPDLLLRWWEAFLMIPAYHWLAYRLFGKEPDFRKAGTWGRYALFVVIFMVFYAPLWGYACGPRSGVFPPEESYRRIVPALFSTLIITWVVAPLLMLGALPLARRFGLFWAENPGRVREYRLGSQVPVWESGKDTASQKESGGVRGLPIRILVAVPFITLVLVTVALVAFLSLRSGEQTANRLAERLHREITNNILLQVDDALAAPDPSPERRLAAVSAVLHRLSISRSGRAFIADREGRVLASSTNGVASSVAATALQTLRAQAGGLAAVAEPRLFRFSIVAMAPFGGETWLAQAAPYRPKGEDTSWLVVTAIPESDFLGGIQEGNSRAAVIFTIALIAAVLLAAALSELVTKPLRRLADSVRAIASGDLHRRVPGSQLDELQTLSESFNDMAERILESFSRVRVSEEKLRTVLDISPLAVSWANDEGQIEFWNRKALSLFGYAQEEISTVEKWFERAYPDPEYRRGIIERWGPSGVLRHDGEINRGEYGITCKDGHVIAVEIFGARCGNLTLAFFNDITERKITEEQLRRSEARFRLFSEVSPVAVSATHGPQLTTEYINSKFVELFGYTLEEIPDSAHWWARAYPDPEYSRKLKERWLSQITAGSGDTFRIKEPVEAEVTCKDGSKKTILWDFVGIEGKNIIFGLDLTARKQAEHALRVVSDRLQVATEAAGIGIWDWDVGRDELVWDDSMYDLYGIRREDFGGAYEAWTKALHPEDADRVNKAIQSALRGEKEYNEEFRILRSDGSIRHIQAGARTTLDADGKPLRMVGVNYDITERKRAEEELRRHRDHLEELVSTRTAELARTNASLEKSVRDLDLNRYMLDRATIAVYLIDREGRFIYVNECAAQYSGYTRKELLSMRVSDLNPELTPEDWAERWSFVHTRPGGELDVARRIHRRKDGSTYPIELLAHHITYEGQTYHLSMGIDITERKAAEDALLLTEARLDQALSLTRSGYWSMVIGEDHYASSERVAEIFGEPPSPGWRYSLATWGAGIAAVDPSAADVAAETFRRACAGETPLYDAIYPYKRSADGRVIWVHALGKIITRPGHPNEMYGVVQDITGVVEAKQELEEARKAAEQANRLKSAFLANMSHEIRTPMNAILGYAQLLQRDKALSPAHLGQVDTINRAGEHLLAIINDILAMSKIEAGHVVLNAVSFNLHETLDRLIELCSVGTRAKGLALRLTGASDVPVFIVSDESKLRQILLNLIGNAVKFTAAGEIHVTADATRTSGEDVSLRFAVADTGPGIAPAELKKLFQPFVQSAEGMRAGGTGLGLSIGKQYAKLLGGDITVESELGRGSTFTLTLRARIAKSASIVVRGEKPAILGLAEDTSPPRVLVVDDLPMNRQLLADMLTPIGFDVQLAEDGCHAVDAFAQWKPQAIIMDMRMPVMDGIEATRRIKAMPGGADTFIIALSASAFEEDRRAFEQSGADIFLAKPIRQDEILEHIGERLGLRYVYAETVAAPAPMSRIDPVAVANIASPMRAAFAVACLEADYAQLMELCDTLAATEPETASALRALVTIFDYERLSALFPPQV